MAEFYGIMPNDMSEEHLHPYRLDELKLDLRFTPVIGSLSAGQERSQVLDKLNTDPLDVLIWLMAEPSVQQSLADAQIDTGLLATNIIKYGQYSLKYDIFSFIGDPKLRKPSLSGLHRSINEAINIANLEDSLEITGPHLLAGMLSQEDSPVVRVFRKTGISEEQLNSLRRVSANLTHRISA